MKKQVKDLTNRQINMICDKQKSCDQCPLKRVSEDGRRQLLCYKKCRALFYSNKIWHDQIMKCEDMTEKEREYHKAMWEIDLENHRKLESEEIETDEIK